ncbi:MAG: hypothetical protein AB4206_15065 [Xenococcaceae cyanobacterium]
MLHLAQVQQNSTSGEMELKLLACQKSENVWHIGESQCLPLADPSSWGEGALVLVECGNQGQIVNIKEAKDLVLSLLAKSHDNNIITPQFVEAEQAKVEQWRQEITSHSLELNRRALEIETRREQLQELEQILKQDQEKLAQQEERVQKLADEFKQKQ